MADKKGIQKLDEKLIETGIIPEFLLGDLPLVHRKMNSILKKTGAVLSDEIFDTGNEALRKWLLTLYKQGASQEKLTGYLRCGLAHLNYDYIESQYRQIGIDDLVTRTLLSLKRRKLHATFFKPPQESVKPVKQDTAAPAKKTAASKKIVPIKKDEAAQKKAKTVKPAKAAPIKPKAAQPGNTVPKK